MSSGSRRQPSRPGAPRTRRRDGPATREQILIAAEKLFARHGFDGVSTKQIAAQAGVAIGALYHHFPGKEDIYAAVTRRAFASRSALPHALLDSAASAEQKLVQMVTWFVRNVLMDKTFGLLLKREMLDPRPSTPHLLDEDVFHEQVCQFKALITELAPAADSDEALAAMLALVFGFANMKGIYTLFPGLSKTLETPEEIAEYATRLLLRGL